MLQAWSPSDRAARGIERERAAAVGPDVVAAWRLRRRRYEQLPGQKSSARALPLEAELARLSSGRARDAARSKPISRPRPGGHRRGAGGRSRGRRAGQRAARSGPSFRPCTGRPSKSRPSCSACRGRAEVVAARRARLDEEISGSEVVAGRARRPPSGAEVSPQAADLERHGGWRWPRRSSRGRRGARRSADADRHRWSARAEALSQALDEARARAGARRLAEVDGVLGALVELVDVDQGVRPRSKRLPARRSRPCSCRVSAAREALAHLAGQGRRGASSRWRGQAERRTRWGLARGEGLTLSAWYILKGRAVGPPGRALPEGAMRLSGSTFGPPRRGRRAARPPAGPSGGSQRGLGGAVDLAVERPELVVVSRGRGSLCRRDLADGSPRHGGHRCGTGRGAAHRSGRLPRPPSKRRRRSGG